MAIKVRLFGELMRAAEAKEILIDEPIETVRDLIELLLRKRPNLSSFLSEENVRAGRLIILVNGHSIKMINGMETRLLSGDVISIERIEILQTVGGG
jgi:molybdopterin converting factor small subunit